MMYYFFRAVGIEYLRKTRRDIQLNHYHFHFCEQCSKLLLGTETKA